MGIAIDLKATAFFDRAEVLARLEPAKRRGLSKQGAILRRRAKSGLRTTRKVRSRPGERPRVRPGSELKGRIYFAFDFANESVVVGPEAFGKALIPSALELGGETLTYGRKGAEARFLEARPFMAPALAEAIADRDFQRAFEDAYR